MKINANTTHGRVLIALRAGHMDSSQIRERVGTNYYTLSSLIQDGLIKFNNDVYQLTDTGREACPNRRDAAMEPMHQKRPAKVIQHLSAVTAQVERIAA